MKLDFLIRGATVFDGERIEPRRVDVGVAGERIAFVGSAPAAPTVDEIVDGSGLYLTPGFVDSHASTGLGYMLPNAADNKLFQGVTTEVVGNCGTSTGPIGPLLRATMVRLAGEIGFDFTWQGLGDWIGQVERYGLPFNSATFVGHGTLRGGFCADPRNVSDEEIADMTGALDQAMDAGALGLSAGLVYAPGSLASTDELVTLAKLAGRRGGLYVSHIRNERKEVEASVEEAIEIGRRGGLPVLVSHLKVAERSNWGKMPRLIERIERARAAGQPVSFDVYPYTAVSTKLRTFLPKAIMDCGVDGLLRRLGRRDWRRRCHDWLLDNGTDFDAMVMITDSLPGAAQRSIAAIAAQRGTTPERTTTDLLALDPDAWIVYHCIDQAELDLAILWPDSMICSDSWSHPVNAPHQVGDPHPRTYGALTRWLERYALTEERLPFGAAIRKITSLPADWLGLEGRGRIAVGACADLVLLDPARVRERATFAEPRQMSEGCERVWVNGVTVLDQGVVSEARPGRFLRRGRSAEQTRRARRASAFL